MIIQIIILLISITTYEKENQGNIIPTTNTEIERSNDGVNFFNTLFSSDTTSISVLFVGNSLTYTNSMPSILSFIAKNYRINIKTKCMCISNSALMDHWSDGSLKATIENGEFDFVILQQGPSSQPYGRSILIEYGQDIKEFADKYDVITAFYMVWPSVSYYHTFDGVIESYTMAAEQSGSLLLPVGAVWKDYIHTTNDESLYGSDWFHPSKKGSFLAAWVIYHSVYPEMELMYNSNYKDYISEEDFDKMNDSFLSVIN